MTQANGWPGASLRLREVREDAIEFDLLVEGERVRSVTALAMDTGARFPHVLDESGESTGDPEIDALICERATSILVLRGGRRRRAS